MRTRPKLFIVATTVSLAALGAGLASAQTARPAAGIPTMAATETAGPHTDTLQQGDQTTPDTAAIAAGAAPAASQAATVTRQRSTSVAATQTGQTAGEATGETTAETAAENGSESDTNTSDGPGGHQDPAGDVQQKAWAGDSLPSRINPPRCQSVLHCPVRSTRRP